jgi:hypothetical protein
LPPLRWNVMSSTHDGRGSQAPGQPGKRRVLRKIESGQSGSSSGTLRPPSRHSEPAQEVAPAQLHPVREITAPSPVAAAATAIAQEPRSLSASSHSLASKVPTAPWPDARASGLPASAPPPSPDRATYTSVPPVVATVPSPPPISLAAPRHPPRGPFRGVVFGAVLGLAIVGAFVAGTRLALRAAAKQPVASAVGVPLEVQPPTVTAVAAAQPQSDSPPSPLPAMTEDVVPTIAATQLPPARQAPRSRMAGKVAGTPRPAPAGQATAPTPVEKPQTVAAVAASGAPSSEPVADYGAVSLVPVIPASPAPAVDPFVKAVQSDIEEDSKGR